MAEMALYMTIVAAAMLLVGCAQNPSTPKSEPGRASAPAGNAREKPGWELVFEENFDGPALDHKVWEVDAAPHGFFISGRWPENVSISDGLLRLETKKEERAGQHWTTGHIWTKEFRPQYGLFEARIRIGGTPGLNNAFWLRKVKGHKSAWDHWEVCVETHYPNKVNIGVQVVAKGKVNSPAKTWTAPVPLDKDFHIFGILWTEKEWVFTLDGQEIDRHENIINEPAYVALSTGVAPWAGGVTDALIGTHMDVDWIRAYRPKQP